MNNKQKKKYLMQYTELKQELTELELRYNELKETMIDPPIQKLSHTPIENSNPNTFKIVNQIVKQEDLEDKKKDVLEKFLKIENIINNIDDSLQRRIMKLRYLDNYKWENICVKINYSWIHTHRLHSIALSKIEIIWYTMVHFFIL